MPRALTRAQARQNAHFLERLASSGNARLAARETGVAISTMHFRRGLHPAFAQGWEAAVTAAHARFHLGGGRRGPSRDHLDKLGTGFARGDAATALGASGKRGGAKRTKGGEPVVVRSQNGKLQLRLAHPNKLTTHAEQAFLRALAASANVHLSAAAAGASEAAFYRRKRQNPAFAREWRLALQEGYDRLELELLARAEPGSYADDAWRETEPAPSPPLSNAEALHLMHLHQKEARLGWDKPHRRRRRGEAIEHYRMRLFLQWRAEQRHVAEDRAIARAQRWAETGDWRLPGEPERPPELPPLDQVTGWSKADPAKTPHHEGVPMFGGWRIGDMRRKMGG